jgi:hypothetical protein
LVDAPGGIVAARRYRPTNAPLTEENLVPELNRRLVAFALASTLALAARPAFAQDYANNPKLADIKRLMNMTGAGSLGKQVMEQLIPSFKSAMPSVPDKFWQDFVKEANPDELVDQVALIYDKYLTHEEVKQVIKFYETPAGKKLIAVLPKVTQESMVVGQQWGRKLGERIQQKLQQSKDKGQ